MNIKNLKKGFTLVELLVVIAIIGILSTLLIIQLNSARGKARDAKRISDVNQMRTAIEFYANDNGKFPTTLGEAAKYLSNKKIPVDPTTSLEYDGYGVSSDGSQYQVWAQLEKYNINAHTSDADLDADGWAPNGVPGAEPGGTACTGGDNDCIFDLGV